MTNRGLIVYRKTLLGCAAWALAILLSACGSGGSGTAHTASEVVTVSADKQQIVGYWTPSDPSGDAYEFFSSATESPFDTALRTGRILRNGNVLNTFLWDMRNDGTIVLNLSSADCPYRPLSSCPSTGTVAITASGSSTQDALWSISFDDNGDGVSDRKVSDRFHRVEIDLSTLRAGPFWLHHINNEQFDAPLQGSVSGGTLSVRLEDLDQAVTVSAAGFTAKQATIHLDAAAQSSITVAHSFYITGSGYTDLPVKQWADQATLSASANGNYTLSYLLHRQVQLPSGVDRAQVEADNGTLRYTLADYEADQSVTRVVGLISQFVAAPAVQAGQRYYLSMELNFQKARAGNDLLFSSATDGVVSDTLAHHPALISEQRNFSWSARDDGSLALNFPGYGEVDLHFIKPIIGGYQVLYTLPDQGYGPAYRIRDMIRDAPPVVDASNLAGRYVFNSTDELVTGSHEYSVTFHRDHTVSGAVGGYWFQDTNGDLVGFECSTLAGQDISDYATCAASLDNPAAMSFAHVRRLRFVARDGNIFQAKYNATVYGTRSFLFYPPTGDPVLTKKFFTAPGAQPDSVALTYRFERVGDE